jgi:uncharacterized protein YqgV (UPF0045/DUF77 family)
MRSNVIIIRRAGALALVAAAIAVWLLMAPDEPVMPEVQVQDSVSDTSDDIAEALGDYALNEANTQGAPQQTVVNGWTAKDLLTIIAKQQNEALTRDPVPTPLTPIVPNDERVPALIGLLVLGLGLALFTAPRSPRRKEAVLAEQRGDTMAALAS